MFFKPILAIASPEIFPSNKKRKYTTGQKEAFLWSLTIDKMAEQKCCHDWPTTKMLKLHWQKRP